MKTASVVLCVLAISLCYVTGKPAGSTKKRDANESGLLIGAFNVKTLGKTKMSKPDVVDILVKVIRRYDVILIQEIRDADLTVVNDLLDKVNEQGSIQYSVKSSERLGRTSYKEQYAFYYRSNDVILSDDYQYEDLDDKFEREPYSIRITSNKLNLPQVVLVGLHAKPSDVPSELNSLVEVSRTLEETFETPNIVILGDLNADCSYFTRTEKEASGLRGGNFYWVIQDSADTTVSENTNCAYDRFVLIGEHLYNSYARHSAAVFRFDNEYGLTNDEAKAVSDHYPVEITLT